MFDYCIIMAGGSGTRLLPASKSKKPKQFLPVSKNTSDTFSYFIVSLHVSHFSLTYLLTLCTVAKKERRVKIGGWKEKS